MNTPAEKKRLLAQKAAAINKAFKKTVIASADKVKNPYFVRRPTGIMELDIDLAGGFPPGISMISGPDGIGKSHLLYRTMAMHQRIYGEKSAIALASVEAPLDHFFLRKLGVIVSVPDEAIKEKNDWKRRHGLPGFNRDEVKELKRQVGTFWDITGATMEQTLMSILEVLSDKTLRENDNQFGIIGVDSLNAMIPQALQQAELDENAMRAAHASCLTRFFAQYYPLSTSLDGDQMYTTILFTQQVRSNSSKASAPAHIAKYLPDFVPATGAYAAKHGKLIDILLYGGQKKKALADEERGGKKETLQKTLGWEIIKGKAGVHEGVTGEIAFDFGESDFIDLQRSVLVSGMRQGVFQENSGRITFVSPQTGLNSEVIKDIPTAEFVQRMKDSPDFEMEMRHEVLASLKIECRYI